MITTVSPPVLPVAPVSPVAPVAPVEPVEPMEPVEPVEPVEPMEPVEPVEPVDPVAPVAPVAPAGPGTVTTGVTTGCLSQALRARAANTAETMIKYFIKIPLSYLIKQHSRLDLRLPTLFILSLMARLRRRKAPNLVSSWPVSRVFAKRCNGVGD